MNKKVMLPVLTIGVIAAAMILNIIVPVYNIVSYKRVLRLLPIVGMASLVVGIALLILKRKKCTVIISVLFLFSLLVSNLISTSVINNQRQNVFTNGTRIAHALNGYYKDHNNYPKNLKDLVPNYIESIPKIKTTYDRGEEFSYYVENDRESYHLGFEQYYYDKNGWAEQP